MRRVLAVLMVVLPQPVKRWVGRNLLGWDIHPTAHLGRSLILARHVSMGPSAGIGPFNLIRDLDELRLGEGANIGSRNWILGVPLSSAIFPADSGRDPSLVLGDYAMITVGHDIDCADRVELEHHAVIAGFKSVVFTHNLNFVTDRFETAPVILHEYAALLSGCTLLTGTRLPARSIVSAGSVVTTRLTEDQTFYRGNPAEAVRALPANLRYFMREGRQAQLENEVQRRQAAGT